MQARIEAALYAAGRPLSPEELTKAAGVTSKRKALSAVRLLSLNVNRTLRAVEISELTEHRFVMQLKPEYSGIARKFSARPLLNTGALKTLSHIIFFQPITAPELARRRGPAAYQHVKELEAVGFVRGEPAGRTKIYRTTTAFSEYFGLSKDPTALKEQLSSVRVQNILRAGARL